MSPFIHTIMCKCAYVCVCVSLITGAFRLFCPLSHTFISSLSCIPIHSQHYHSIYINFKKSFTVYLTEVHVMPLMGIDESFASSTFGKPKQEYIVKWQITASCSVG